MTKRLNPYVAAPDTMKPLIALEATLKESGLEHSLIHLVKMRASQINGCAYCLDMHAPEARAAGVSQQKLDVLAAWRESPAFDARERAALGWAEALTRIEATGAPDADYDALAAEFTEQERAEVTFVITSINTWNRFAVGFRAVHPIRKEA